MKLCELLPYAAHAMETTMECVSFRAGPGSSAFAFACACLRTARRLHTA